MPDEEYKELLFSLWACTINGPDDNKHYYFRQEAPHVLGDYYGKFFSCEEQELKYDQLFIHIKPQYKEALVAALQELELGEL